MPPMNTTTIVSILVESCSIPQGWRVIAKHSDGNRHPIGGVHASLEAALAMARRIQAQLA